MKFRGKGIVTSARFSLVAGVAGLFVFSSALGQGNPNQFGGQERANAASELIVLGVQQGISSLPPTSGQSFVYEFDPALANWVSSEQLGPTALRSPQTVGANKFSLRASGSYFELADTKQPIFYQVNNSAGTPLGVAKIGLQADAKVGLMNFGANYGITDRLEITLNVPVVIVNAQASQSYSALTAERNLPADQAQLAGVSIDPSKGVAEAEGLLNSELQSGKTLFVRRDSFNALGFDFNDGTHVGVGRISVGAKGVVYADKLWQVAFAPEFFCNSPNQDQFSGSNSPAILPRFIVAGKVAEQARMLVDAGYDYDFDHNELRRFVWNGGGSYAISGATFDAGVGGSTFNEGIKWTPTVAPFTNGAQTGTIQALQSNRFGRTFVDFLGGVKVRVANKTVLSGSVNVPLNNEGFRAAAVGTVAVEQYF